MPEKKRTMNDMIVTKKTVVKKQVIQPRQIVSDPEPELEEELDEENDELTEEIAYYRDETPTRSRSGCLLWIIASICVIALVVGIGGLFTHAKVSLTPKQFTGDVDTTISLSQTHEENSVFFGTATKTFTSEKIVPSIGKSLSEVKATGTVKFYNTNTTSKTIPAKTEIISSTGKKYTTTKTITIPAKGAKDPGQIDVAVAAIVSGIEGNSELDDFTFSKPTKALAGITIHSVTEIGGGASDTDAVADPELIAGATQVLRNEFSSSQNFTNRLSEQVPDSMIALPLLLPENSVSIVIDPKHEDGVHITGSQTVTILMVNRQDIARALGNNLGAAKDLKLILRSFNNASVMTNGVVAGQPVPQKLQVRITGQMTVFGLLDTELIKSKILGLSRKATKEYLGQVPEIGSYEIKMRPFWRRVLPMNIKDVEVAE